RRPVIGQRSFIGNERLDRRGRQLSLCGTYSLIRSLIRRLVRWPLLLPDARHTVNNGVPKLQHISLRPVRLIVKERERAIRAGPSLQTDRDLVRRVANDVVILLRLEMKSIRDGPLRIENGRILAALPCGCERRLFRAAIERVTPTSQGDDVAGRQRDQSGVRLVENLGHTSGTKGAEFKPQV